MANIEQDLQAIMEARYGKDVRQSIHDAIYDINEVNEANISTVQTIADTAQGYANTALQAKTDAQTAQTGAETAQTNASNSAKDAEAWAVGKRNGTDVPSTDPAYENNSKYWQERANYWYEQAKSIAESFSGALRPMGTVTFANLPPVSQATVGDMYNVSDEFTTTSDFKEGAGHVIPLGSNVYKTTDDKWDVLAGSPVTGIKGDSEQSYRKGNVNITKNNIGLGNVDNESLGSADISAIGDGSVKGAITSLDAEIDNKQDTLTSDKTEAGSLCFRKYGDVVSIFSTGWAGLTIGTVYIPEKYRSDKNIYVSGLIAVNSWNVYLGTLQFSPDGKLANVIYAPTYAGNTTAIGTGNMQVQICASYIV